MELISNDLNLDNLSDSYIISVYDQLSLLDISLEEIEDYNEFDPNSWYKCMRFFKKGIYYCIFDRKNYSDSNNKIKLYQISLFKEIFRCNNCDSEYCCNMYCNEYNQEIEECILYNKNLSTNFLDSILKYNFICLFLQNNNLSNYDLIDYYNKIYSNNFIFLNKYLEKNLPDDVLQFLFDFL